MSRRDSVLVSRTLYQVGVLTLITALLWVGVGVYSTVSQPLNVKVEKETLEPVNSEIDQEVIQALTGRLKVEELVIEVVEEASGSATIEEAQQI